MLSRYLKPGLVSVMVLTSVSAAASLNIPVASRIIAFMQPAPTGAISAAIIYQPGDAASEAEAAEIQRQFGRGLQAGRTFITATRVPESDLSGLAGKRLAFVTTGVSNQQAIAAIATRNAVLTVTSDMSCVRAGYCMVGISGAQSQITVNKSATQAARIRFGTAFLMLVKEL